MRMGSNEISAAPPLSSGRAAQVSAPRLDRTRGAAARGVCGAISRRVGRCGAAAAAARSRDAPTTRATFDGSVGTEPAPSQSRGRHRGRAGAAQGEGPLKSHPLRPHIIKHKRGWLRQQPAGLCGEEVWKKAALAFCRDARFATQRVRRDGLRPSTTMPLDEKSSPAHRPKTERESDG